MNELPPDAIMNDSFNGLADYVIGPEYDIHLPGVPLDVDQLRKASVVACPTHRFLELARIIRQSNLKKEFVLITGRSDYNVTQTYLPYLPQNVHWWFARNVEIPENRRQRLTQIPIGISSDERGAHYRPSLIANALALNLEPTHDVYINLGDINTNHLHRTSVLRHIWRRTDIKQLYQKDRVDFSTFIQGIRQCRMVLCPPGAGVDTYRFWETLYCGRIPIVFRSPTTEYFHKFVPAILIDLWEELEDINLETQYFRQVSRLWDRKKYLSAAH